MYQSKFIFLIKNMLCLFQLSTLYMTVPTFQDLQSTMASCIKHSTVILFIYNSTAILVNTTQTNFHILLKCSSNNHISILNREKNICQKNFGEKNWIIDL